MDSNVKMTTEEINRVKQRVTEANAKSKRPTGSMKGSMDKDAFLKLLVTELRHQDPTQPMKDREFISQMAQFSALEQMTNINSSMQAFSKRARSTEAYALLGKNVEAFNTKDGKMIRGTVSGLVYRNNDIRLRVGSREIGLEDIHAVLPGNSLRNRNPNDSGPSSFDRINTGRMNMATGNGFANNIFEKSEYKNNTGLNSMKTNADAIQVKAAGQVAIDAYENAGKQ